MLIRALLEKRKNRLLMFAGVWLLFVLYKYEDLFLPYYWDEMAGYMSGVLYLTDHGISLWPAAVPAELSYGHPLLLHCVLAVLGRIAGNGLPLMHGAMLFFTLLLSLGTYLLAFQLSKDRQTSAIAFLIFLIQPMVLAQSGQVLLEVFLTMHTVYALLFYLRKQYLLSVLFCILGILSKETGLVLAIALFLHTVYEWVQGEDQKKSIQRLMLFALPFLVFALFLLATRLSFGWYLNPVNVGKSKLSIESMLQKIWDYPLEITLVNQGRFVASLLALPAIVLWVRHSIQKRVLPGSDVLLLLLYCMGFILFSSIADALERYFVVLLPFASVLFASAFVYYRRYYTGLPLLLAGIVMFTATRHLSGYEKHREIDMGYRHMIYTNQALISFVNSGQFARDTVGIAFPLQLALSDPRYGYYDVLRTHADTSFSKNAAYKLYCSPGNFDWNPPDTARYELLKEFSSGFSRSMLYRRKR